MIRFLLNREPVLVQQQRADLTVLQWLREERAKVGTKEGCASGDCGACTVVVAALVRKNKQICLQYESVNSCITFIGALHGKQLITVEDLADGDQLHPVQQAMVDEHGSQCGFCTPGFIMSMFALYHNAALPALINHSNKPQKLQHRIDRFLGGNLCRCTGYAPIKRAATKALLQHAPDKFDAREEETIRALQGIKKQLPMHPNFLIPRNAKELGTMRIQYPDARLLAGGTDLALEVTQQLNDIDTMIYVKYVPELLQIDVSDSGLSMGAAVSLTRCMQTLGKHLPSTRAMMLRFGSEQIRNQGTIGGNIANASPIGDLPPLLLALNATLELQCGEKRRHVNINEFYEGYKQTALADNEFVRCVHIPLPSTESELFVYKISKRLDDDISAVCGIFNLHIQGHTIIDATIAFGGMAATPARAKHLEDVLRNTAFSESVLEQAASALKKDFTPISDARASSAYREKIAFNLLKRCYLSLQDQSAVMHVSDYVSG